MRINQATPKTIKSNLILWKNKRKITIFYLKCHKYTHLLILENFSQLQIFVKYLTQYYFSSQTFYFEYFC